MSQGKLFLKAPTAVNRYASTKLDWQEGRVDFEHGVDEHGHEFLRCTDNGVGMDEGVITRFLTRAGRSYYRSPEFEQERIRFRAAGTDFDPCSQFGIGFMSCFMLGDRIRIETRRDYGPGRSHGVPWVVEINGLGGMLTLKKGRANQEIGTTVVITSRPKPAFLDTYEDRVRLVSTLDRYALAVEFPLQARCTIPEIAEDLNLPAGIRHITTLLEDIGARQIIRLEQDLSELDPHLRGVVCQAFLIDKTGAPSLENEEARIVFDEEYGAVIDPRIRLLPPPDRTATSRACLDGIRVTSDSWRLNHSRLLVDIRGARKPAINPARIVRGD